MGITQSAFLFLKHNMNPVHTCRRLRSSTTRCSCSSRATFAASRSSFICSSAVLARCNSSVWSSSRSSNLVSWSVSSITCQSQQPPRLWDKYVYIYPLSQPECETNMSTFIHSTQIPSCSGAMLTCCSSVWSSSCSWNWAKFNTFIHSIQVKVSLLPAGQSQKWAHPFLFVSISIFVFFIIFSAFSALTLLVGQQEGNPDCKNWAVGCWHGYLSRETCRLHMAQLMPLPLTVSLLQ